MWPVVMTNRCVSSMLRSALDEGLTSQSATLKFLGERFRMKAELPPWTSDEDVARHMIRWPLACDQTNLPHDLFSVFLLGDTFWCI